MVKKQLRHTFRLASTPLCDNEENKKERKKMQEGDFCLLVKGSVLTQVIVHKITKGFVFDLPYNNKVIGNQPLLLFGN